MSDDAQRFSEPWRTTAIRTGSLALVVGVAVGAFTRQFAVTPLATLLALWFTLGGHFAELLFRNTLRPYLSGPPSARALARLLYWFVAGSALYAGALMTRGALTNRGAVSWPWWAGGAAFTVLEVAVHLLMRARRQPSFFDGRG